MRHTGGLPCFAIEVPIQNGSQNAALGTPNSPFASASKVSAASSKRAPLLAHERHDISNNLTQFWRMGETAVLRPSGNEGHESLEYETQRSRCNDTHDLHDYAADAEDRRQNSVQVAPCARVGEPLHVDPDCAFRQGNRDTVDLTKINREKPLYAMRGDDDPLTA
jgi:hypothetical protein